MIFFKLNFIYQGYRLLVGTFSDNMWIGHQVCENPKIKNYVDHVGLLPQLAKCLPNCLWNHQWILKLRQICQNNFLLIAILRILAVMVVWWTGLSSLWTVLYFQIKTWMQKQINYFKLNWKILITILPYFYKFYEFNF